MQQILNPTPSRKAHIDLFDTLYKKAKKFFTIEVLMLSVFCVSFATYQIFLKKILFKEIHIPLHATHFNIDYNEEKMLLAETEENLTNKIGYFLLEFFCCAILFSFVAIFYDPDYLGLFLSSMFCIFLLSLHILITNIFLLNDLTQNQEKAFTFKKYLNKLLSEIQKYPINLNKNSILETNKYNKRVALYNLKIKNTEDFLKEEESYFKNYVIAQALINLDKKIST